jgi:hypothetical protein
VKNAPIGLPGGQSDAVASRHERFAKMNALVMRRGGWIVSLPGSTIMTIERLPDAAIPEELTKLGYELERLPDGERIVSGAVTETIDAGNSKRPPRVMRYDGPTRVERFSFRFHD